MKEFYAHGKLLISGEYLILDGAKGLALPTKKGQRLIVSQYHIKELHWESYDYQNQCWFTMRCDLDFNLLVTSDSTTAQHLISLLTHINQLNPHLFTQGYHLKTYLEFPRLWGLGSSATLISTLAQWAQIDPFLLLNGRFKGSGYDIACATANSALVYQLNAGQPMITSINFNPEFSDHLFFVYLNQKQLSSESIKAYNNLQFDKATAIEQINTITEGLIQSKDLNTFQTLLEQHEAIMAQLLKTPSIKELYFKDYPGVVKSLGAWGGDFVLLCGPKKTPSYVIEKGFDIVIPFRDMVF